MKDKVREASIQGVVIREMIAHFTSLNGIGKKIKSGELRKKMTEPAWKVPKGYQLTEVQMGTFVMEWLQPEAVFGEKVLLQLHGGGYVGKMRNAYRDFAVRYSDLGQGMPVLTIDYRVAPENPYPAALEDAYSAYQWLLEQGYAAEQIIVAGDSAGGGLAMALCMYLKAQKVPLPCGIIAMSPWTDLTNSGESYVENYEKDPLFGKTKESLLYNRDYAGMEDVKNPYISPVFGDFSDFPPMLIQAGSYEMLLSDAKMVAQKARKQGVKVRLTVYEGMFHVFQMSMDMMPESIQAWKEIGKFMEVLKHSKA
ncbi:MAG: alpha/beta hydrolase [Lachnospiraceae bacterium]|nr:alpha/beta hydrolase [Lachnospiraceae bacterium]